VISDPTDKDGCTSTPIWTICTVANIVRDPEGLVRFKLSLFQEADVDAVLSEELVHLKLPVANPVSVPISQPQGFLR
jgi:hypothetical protein